MPCRDLPNPCHLLQGRPQEADLTYANLSSAEFDDANLSGAVLYEANLTNANLFGADLSGANLSDADLSRAQLVGTNFTDATLTNCKIYGIAAWNVDLRGAKQDNLIITPDDELIITVDNLKIAQFIYLLLNNAEIREVIDTITSKVVLILSRFTPERKAVLDALRDELRKHNYSPVLFDFEKPASRDLTETVSTLAHLARFIIVDLTDPSSAPHEVATVIPHTVVPVLPLMLDGQREYSMFRDLRRRHDWVLPTYFYTDQAQLLAALNQYIITPAERKASERLCLLSFERDQCLGGQGIGEGIQSCIFEHAVEISEGCSHNPQGTRTDWSFPCQYNIHALLIRSRVELAAKTIAVKGDICSFGPASWTMSFPSSGVSKHCHSIQRAVERTEQSGEFHGAIRERASVVCST